MSHSIVAPGPIRGLPAIVALTCALAVAACAVGPPSTARVGPAHYVPVAWTDLPGWHDDSVESAWPALQAGCAALVANAGTRASWQSTCADAARDDAPDAATARRFFETHFSPYRIVDADGSATGLVTGYYEPLLDGSRTRDAVHVAPIYGVPDDLLVVDLATLYPELAGKRVRGRIEGRRVVPYWTRAEIEAGLAPLSGKALAFLADPIDAFFLEVQGSGRIRLPDGRTLRVGYADQNGQPYTPVARVLIERGEMTRDTASLQAIRAWGERNRDRLAELLDHNASYVFFREVSPPAPGTLEARIDGPTGSLGVPLLARRTIAVDAAAIPLGAPVFIDTTRPSTRAPLRALTLAQDTGGAIRGAVRADFFWGTGDDAAREAGLMREPGRLWLLWPTNAPLPGGRRADSAR